MTPEQERVAKASKEIGAILSAVEHETRKRIAEIGLRTVEVTRVDDAERRVATSVTIDLEDPYKREWV